MASKRFFIVLYDDPIIAVIPRVSRSIVSTKHWFGDGRIKCSKSRSIERGSSSANYTSSNSISFNEILFVLSSFFFYFNSFRNSHPAIDKLLESLTSLACLGNVITDCEGARMS